MSPEQCRNKQEYSIIYEKLLTAVREINHEETLRLAHIAYKYVFERRKGREGELEMLSEIIDTRHDLIELSREIDRLISHYGGQTQ